MIDLHHHFDGAFDIDALYTEAKRRNLPQGKLTAGEFAAHCQVPADCHTLTQFLAVFDFFYDIAQDADFLHAQAKQLPWRMADSGVIYLETRFGPHLFLGNRYSAENITESVITGLESSAAGTIHDRERRSFLSGAEVGTQKVADRASTVRLILCAMRNSPVKTISALIDLYEKFSHRGVCGIDLAGDESQYACREYAPVFARAHELGIPITIHAGEAAGPQSVYDALDLFHARRIGHGIRSIEDSVLVKRLADEKIGLEVCLTSNLQTGNAASYQSHPFMRLKEAGVLVTVNTDDPSVSGIDLTHEWERAIQEYKFTRADQRALLMNSVQVAFCDEAMKARLREQVNQKFG